MNLPSLIRAIGLSTLLLAAPILLNAYEPIIPPPEQVLICESPSAHAYHKKKCYGLQQCTKEINKVTRKEAMDGGYRPCKICY